ncbi:MAG TPA: hypothetical protein VHN79_10710, partial [Lacunisphaera sp.]|nr:hypothetical protein [Lacunisphaera sp.]
EEPVAAASSAEFNTWRASHQDDLPPAEWQWFDVAIQEFKLALMREGKLSGSGAIDEAVRAKIHGRPLADVMREGLQAHVRRKTAERAEMDAAFALNASRRIPPDDTATLRDMANHQENLRVKMNKLDQEIAAANAALAPLEARGR